MCNLVAVERGRAACLGCWWEGLCFAKGGKYFAAMRLFPVFYYRLLSAGSTRWPGMIQAAGAVILLRWLQHQACQSCKDAGAHCASTISGYEAYPRPPHWLCSCTREAGSNLPIRSGAGSAAGLQSQVCWGHQRWCYGPAQLNATGTSA